MIYYPIITNNWNLIYKC